MRKLIYAISLLGSLPLCTLNARAEAPAMTSSPILATWEMVSSKMSCMPDDPGLFPKDRRKVKVLSGNQFVWVDYERASGKVLSMAGGSFELQGTQYTEKVEFASKELQSLIGKTFVFQVKVEAEKLLQSGDLGEDLKVEETWKKAPPAPAAGLLSQTAPKP